MENAALSTIVDDPSHNGSKAWRNLCVHAEEAKSWLHVKINGLALH